MIFVLVILCFFILLNINKCEHIDKDAYFAKHLYDLNHTPDAVNIIDPFYRYENWLSKKLNDSLDNVSYKL
jgi:hypothetical protein